MTAALLLAVGALTASAVGPPRAALSVSPAHVSLAAGGAAVVRVHAGAGPRLVLHTSLVGLGLDGQGRPRIAARRDLGAWLTVQPRTIALGRNGARMRVVARRVARARPGDHTALVLLTASVPGTRGVAVAMRVGLVVTVRVAGRVQRRLDVVAARAARSRILVTVANRGDLIEPLGADGLRVTLTRHGRTLARLPSIRRSLLPRSRAVVAFPYRPRIRGAVVVRVELQHPGGSPTARRFRLRL